MRKPNLITFGLLAAAACGGSQRSTSATTATAPTPDESAQRPSEALGTNPEPLPLFVVDDSIRPGTRLAVRLDETIGPQFSTEGKVITATVIPVKREDGTIIFPEGTKVRLRIARIQAAMSGTLGAITLVPRVIEYKGAFFPIDGRIVAVQVTEPASGRPVAGTGADMPGAIVAPRNLTPVELERDVLGKGTVISVGANPPDSQLNEGTALALELRGPVPLALWQGKQGELDVGWLRDLLVLTMPRDTTELLGKRVELRGQHVESVIGDVVFWVGPSRDRRVLVVMDQYLDEPETRTVVKTGQTISLVGVVEAMPSRELAPYLWKMVTEKEAAELQPHPAYIYASRVQIDQPAPSSEKSSRPAKTAPRATSMR